MSKRVEPIEIGVNSLSDISQYKCCQYLPICDAWLRVVTDIAAMDGPTTYILA